MQKLGCQSNLVASILALRFRTLSRTDFFLADRVDVILHAPAVRVKSKKLRNSWPSTVLTKEYPRDGDQRSAGIVVNV